MKNLLTLQFYPELNSEAMMAIIPNLENVKFPLFQNTHFVKLIYNSDMNWVFLAAGSTIFFTFLALLQRRVAVDSKYPKATAIVFNLWGATLATVVFLITGGFKEIHFPPFGIAWVFAITACLFYGLFERGRFIASKLLDASVIAVISNIEFAIVFILSIFLYAESPTTQKAIGTALIMSALILVGTLDKIHKKISLKGVGFAVLISIFLAIGWSLDKKGVTYFSPATYNLIVWTIPLVFIYFPYIKTQEIIYEARRASWKVPTMAFLNVVGYFLQLKALTIAEITRVVPIVNSYTVFTVILAAFILGEKQHFLRKILAALIGLTGAYLLTTI